ncbi:MAG: hypothetical protein UW88_C0008G0007 [Candidatus Collierbacteria bacterium GW2011_GWD2_45_10]|nr:MAG: hypothetical protein UW31_C0013G0007 [Candidatus Collierbacteria bacterium GW2011_GWA2_44_13]KKT62484.1 MAG: hypothetical protein UW56_C0006G0007 [Candidatus Collierbacteria bacterium GW2011_GWD1_44_27]KKT88733.1 MAG: hypothetical protein UW88_C0008G0007 [Candidatus Collierbacteria bacterium GW2011_GWD2_45_10]
MTPPSKNNHTSSYPSKSQNPSRSQQSCLGLPSKLPRPLECLYIIDFLITICYYIGHNRTFQETEKPMQLAQDNMHVIRVKPQGSCTITGLKLGKNMSNQQILHAVPFDGREIHLTVGVGGTHKSRFSTSRENQKFPYTLRPSGKGDYLMSNHENQKEVTIDEGQQIEFRWTSDCGHAGKDVNVKVNIFCFPSKGEVHLVYTVTSSKK